MENPMSSRLRDAFLSRQFEKGMELAGNSDILDLKPQPDRDPPCRYVAHFEGCRGLVRDESGQVVEFPRFVVGVSFPQDYLRHVITPQVLTYLGPHSEPWHPNILPPFVDTFIEPGTALVDILHVCHEIWTWNLFATGDEGLNHAAAQWSRQQEQSRFPIDRRPLKRRAVQIAVTDVSGKEAP
jgi:hypothetical protein